MGVQAPPIGFEVLGQEGDGCSYWLQLGSYSVLLDCGLLHPVLSRRPDVVVCSHAHPDHLQGVAQVQHQFPDVPILSTRATYRLADQLYPVLPPFQCLPFNRAIEVLPDLTVAFFRAGHLPGAAAIVLQYRGLDPPQTCIYTGDCSLFGTRFTEGLDLQALRPWHADVLIVDGALGTRQYPPRRQLDSQLINTLTASLQNGELVIIPVPQVGMGQELLFLLKTHHHFTQGQPPITLWVDPAVSQGCDSFADILSELPPAVQNFAQYQSLFWEERVQPLVKPLRLDHPWDLSQPGLLFCHAQASADEWQHLWDALDQTGSLPLRWLEFPHITPSQPLSTWPFTLRRRLHIQRSHWHSHCDSTGLSQIVHTLRPQHVVLVHAPLHHLTDLANLPELSSRYHVHCPSLGHRLELTRSSLFLPVESQPRRYTGEVQEVFQDPDQGPTAIQIVLPPALTQDPRWSEWFDTGLVEARWQGDELVLRKLSAQELMRPQEGTG